MANSKKKKKSPKMYDGPSLSKLFEKTPEGKTNPHQFTFLIAAGLFVMNIPLSIQLAFSMGTYYSDFFAGAMDAMANLFNFSRLMDTSIEGRAFNFAPVSVIWLAYVFIVFFV